MQWKKNIIISTTVAQQKPLPTSYGQFSALKDNKKTVTREVFETDVDLFPYFRLNWALVFSRYDSV